VAARRLILVMLVLLVLSSAVAALIPVERSARDDASTASTTTESRKPSGALVTRRINADEAAKPRAIRIAPGDQLELTVTSSDPGQVEILVLGVLADVDRFFPAHLDLLPADRGTYPVKLIPPEPAGAPGQVIGRIVVEEPPT
jgi:hypothetical protein